MVVPPSVLGGRERGLILHKLLEEVLTGETADDATTLTERAHALIVAMGEPIVDDPTSGLAPSELAGCVIRTFALPEIAELRPTLSPEFTVYSSTIVEGVELATAGITDAISFGPDGKPQVIVDWKSDVRPTTETINHYRAQVRNYLDMTSTQRGLIVLVTSGEILAVNPSPI